MNIKALAVITAALLAIAPFAASASTVGASTSQTQTTTFGTLNSQTVSNQYVNGTEYQLAVSGAISTPQTCVNACTGSSGAGTISYTKTKFSSDSHTNQTFQGVQSSYNITCDVSAYANPF